MLSEDFQELKFGLIVFPFLIFFSYHFQLFRPPVWLDFASDTLMPSSFIFGFQPVSKSRPLVGLTAFRCASLLPLIYKHSMFSPSLFVSLSGSFPGSYPKYYDFC